MSTKLGFNASKFGRVLPERDKIGPFRQRLAQCRPNLPRTRRVRAISIIFGATSAEFGPTSTNFDQIRHGTQNTGRTLPNLRGCRPKLARNPPIPGRIQGTRIVGVDGTGTQIEQCRLALGVGIAYSAPKLVGVEVSIPLEVAQEDIIKVPGVPTVWSPKLFSA